MSIVCRVPSDFSRTGVLVSVPGGDPHIRMPSPAALPGEIHLTLRRGGWGTPRTTNHLADGDGR